MIKKKKRGHGAKPGAPESPPPGGRAMAQTTAAPPRASAISSITYGFPVDRTRRDATAVIIPIDLSDVLSNAWTVAATVFPDYVRATLPETVRQAVRSSSVGRSDVFPWAGAPLAYFWRPRARALQIANAEAARPHEITAALYPYMALGRSDVGTNLKATTFSEASQATAERLDNLFVELEHDDDESRPVTTVDRVLRSLGMSEVEWYASRSTVAMHRWEYGSDVVGNINRAVLNRGVSIGVDDTDANIALALGFHLVDRRIRVASSDEYTAGNRAEEVLFSRMAVLNKMAFAVARCRWQRAVLEARLQKWVVQARLDQLRYFHRDAAADAVAAAMDGFERADLFGPWAAVFEALRDARVTVGDRDVPVYWWPIGRSFDPKTAMASIAKLDLGAMSASPGSADYGALWSAAPWAATEPHDLEDFLPPGDDAADVTKYSYYTMGLFLHHYFTRYGSIADHARRSITPWNVSLGRVDISLREPEFEFTDGRHTSSDPVRVVAGFRPVVPFNLRARRSLRPLDEDLTSALGPVSDNELLSRTPFDVYTAAVPFYPDPRSRGARGFHLDYMPAAMSMGEDAMVSRTADVLEFIRRTHFSLQGRTRDGAASYEKAVTDSTYGLGVIISPLANLQDLPNDLPVWGWVTDTRLWSVAQGHTSVAGLETANGRFLGPFGSGKAQTEIAVQGESASWPAVTTTVPNWRTATFASWVAKGGLVLVAAPPDRGGGEKESFLARIPVRYCIGNMYMVVVDMPMRSGHVVQFVDVSPVTRAWQRNRRFDVPTPATPISTPVTGLARSLLPGFAPLTGIGPVATPTSETISELLTRLRSQINAAASTSALASALTAEAHEEATLKEGSTPVSQGVMDTTNRLPPIQETPPPSSTISVDIGVVSPRAAPPPADPAQPLQGPTSGATGEGSSSPGDAGAPSGGGEAG
jgi:hypothetical protein